jgi:glycosyltransferase involved in cell wall biosynthesis
MDNSNSQKVKKKIQVMMIGPGLSIQGGVTSVEKLILDNTPQHLSFFHVASLEKESILSNIIIFLRAIRLTFLALIRKQVDIYHIHFSERGSTLRKTIFVLLISSFKKSFILHAHGAAFKEFFEGLPTFLRNFISKYFGKCSKLIVLSESWKSYYLSAFCLNKTQVEVLKNPVVFPSNIPSRTKHEVVTFCFLGHIGERTGRLDQAFKNLPKQNKGAFDLIRAFALLSEYEQRSAKMVLAGSGDIEQASELASELGIENCVSIYGWLGPEKRDDLLARSDVFVLPSYNEGLPMSMLEAMAWGLPVIVTPVGGIPEVIIDGQNGLLVEPGNLPELVSAMKTLIHKPLIRQTLSDNAKVTIQTFDINCYLNRLSEIYESALRI